MIRAVYLCDPIRTPIGRYGGVLSGIRADDLAALPLRYLKNHLTQVDWDALDDIILGATNQAGEDNRNLARMAALLAGLPEKVPAVTVNRLCGSGMEAVIQAARAIQSGDAELILAGGAESMSRAPYVQAKGATAFARSPVLEDSTLGWRFVNPVMAASYGVDSMTETAENVAEAYRISRADQDAFALRSQQRAQAAHTSGIWAEEIMAVAVRRPHVAERMLLKVADLMIREDEPPRPEVTLQKLSRLPALVGGTVTAGNACGLNDGAAAMLVASEAAVAKYALQAVARYCGSVAVGVAPRMMGIGPLPAVTKLLARTGLRPEQIDVLEINEAFAAQVLAVIRELGFADDAPQINPNGGAIALGHPLAMTGTRLLQTAALELRRRGGKYAVATMCIGVGQGIATLLEAVEKGRVMNHD
ncbi:MAG TPA: acetyl-CoA C-acyltransferase [Candidatus Obscuribacterales bacterium]